MSLTLVILAAGKGSRFGGDKPLAAVGPDGQSLFEYSVRDAFNAGFRHVVFVVSEHQDTSEYTRRLGSFKHHLEIEFVTQSLATGFAADDFDLASMTRTKPWGTAHAVLVCREHIHNPFVVINADDYYGRGNFKVIGDYLLNNQQNPRTCVLPGYLLKNTLSVSGGVNRGICTVDSHGYLQSIYEARNIVIDAELRLAADVTDSKTSIGMNSIVSMTFWGFTPAVFSIFEKEFQAFLSAAMDLNNDEFYIPEAVDKAMIAGLLKVKVFETAEHWKGITYADDLAGVREFFASLVLDD